MDQSFNGLALSLDAGTLQDFKSNFQVVLTDTITKMIKNGETEGTVSAKLKISLTNMTNEFGTPYKEPCIAYEVTGAVQQKRTEKGILGGEYSLEYSAAMQGYVLRPADVAQTKLDDYL